MIIQHALLIQTPGRGLINITDRVAAVAFEADITTGLCHIFIHHTSASLIICENSDPAVLHDLEFYFGRLVQDGDEIFTHTEEGPDDMSAHVRSILTTSSISLPITDKSLNLGQWQGIFLWEHRLKSYDRKITVTIQA
jgi:secondary thiamine-phosphate synthase enzyme